MAASDLINFKRGTQRELDYLRREKLGVDGCFYLVVDEDTDIAGSSRLYIGRSNGDIVPVNQGIITVSTVGDFPSTLANGVIKAGDFAYAETENILAIYSADAQGNKAWIQLNTDQYLSELANTISVDAQTGVATIVTTGTYNTTGKTNGLPPISSQFEVTGTKGIDVSTSSHTVGSGTSARQVPTLTVQGDEYNIASDHSVTDTATINLSSDKRQNAGTVTLASGANMHITESNNTITLKADDLSVHSLDFDPAAQGFGITLTKGQDANAATLSDSIDPIIVYGENGSSEVHFLQGTATLSVYTIAQIENKLRGLNGMTYKGTVGTGGSAAESLSLLTHVSIGDTFMAVGGNNLPEADGGTPAITIPAAQSANGQQEKLIAGDLLIASGKQDAQGNYINTEGSDGYITGTVVWDIVHSGDDYDTTYEVNGINHGITIYNSLGNKVGELTVNPGTLIEAADTGSGSTKAVTLSHSTVTTTKNSGAQTPQEINNNQGAEINFEVVTGVHTDGHGHVDGYETKQLHITTASTSISGVDFGAAANNNTATVTQTINTVDAQGQSHTDTAAFDITSENLTITATAGTQNTNPVVTANFYWGSFEDDIPAGALS